MKTPSLSRRSGRLLRVMLLGAFLVILTLPDAAQGADVVEFLSGSRVEGEVKQIDKAGRKVTIEATIAGRKLRRQYNYGQIHAVTYRGQRFVINPRAEDSQAGSGKGESRSRAEVQALIDQAGRTPPDWFDSTRPNYPASLDLSWPHPAPQGWNNQKNVGQFIWDIINPNPNRWREGVRLMHHLLSVNKDEPATMRRTMAELGRMYHELLQDYPRAAFWYQQAGVGRGSEFDRSKNGAHLAECYWRLGNKEMAVELLNQLPVTFESIKLWGDLGETQKCMQLATLASKNARWPADCYLLIGDAYRLAGDYDQALAAYHKALEMANKPQHVREEKSRVRAQANISAIRAIEKLDLKSISDGKYRADSMGYEGPIEVEVSIQNGRITDTKVTKHREKQFYSSIEDTTRKIVEQQGIRGVDATSGATITSEAILNATAEALNDAMPK